MPHRQIRLLAPDDVVETGLERIREQKDIPAGFGPEVKAELELIQPRLPETDMTDIPFVTLDPPGARDLDQAFHLAQRRGGYQVTYAIADIGAFFEPTGPIASEAFDRGQTMYAPDVRTPLYPEELSEGRASLLPDHPRPALVWEIALDAHGRIESGRVRRAMVRSRAQLSYPEAQDQLDSGSAPLSLDLLPEIGRLRQIIEQDRGAVSLNTPEQLVMRRDGGWALEFRAPLPIEGWNAQLSLLTGMFAGSLMADAGVGILRTLPPADPERVARLRRVAKALGIAWPESVGYPALIRSLHPRIPAHAAFLSEATTLFSGAGYQALDGEAPRAHSALATIYAHTTAPLRRLVDRFAGETCLALVAGRPVPDWVISAIPSLPSAMARSETRTGQYEAACVDLVEAALMSGREGDVFAAVVVDVEDDKRSGKVQLRSPAVMSSVDGQDLDLGEEVMVKVANVSVIEGRVRFELA